MILRSVRVTIAPGKYDAYWSWAEDIVALWDAGGVRRAGGPYNLTGPGGENVALWLTVHESEEQARDEFTALYSSGRGKELIEARPALVSASESAAYTEWTPGAGDRPQAPDW